jgi:PII-like signaling protein
MNGYQVTFFTHQDRRFKGKQIGDWLMNLVQELGLRGASLHAGGESFARGGRVHSAHFFELADQPIAREAWHYSRPLLKETNSQARTWRQR